MILRLFQGIHKATFIFQAQSYNRMYRVCVRVCDSWLTLTAIWFHYAGHRSDAFYDRSQYIPQA